MKLVRILNTVFYLLVTVMLIIETIWVVKYALTQYEDEMFELMSKMIVWGIPTLTIIILWNSTKE